MNKKSELEILSAAVAALGNNSYCSQWLAEQIPFIKSAIESDMYPQFRAIGFAEMQDRARRMREDAQAEAALIISDANARRDKLLIQAQLNVADIKRRAITALSAL